MTAGLVAEVRQYSLTTTNADVALVAIGGADVPPVHFQAF